MKQLEHSKQEPLRFVCRDGCHQCWQECEHVPICPHARLDDYSFSINASLALDNLNNGKSKTDCAKAHGISVREFYLYRKAINEIT